MTSESYLRFNHSGWLEFLKDWNAEIGQILPRIPSQSRSAIWERVVADGTVLRTPADEKDIQAAERSIGLALPESLKRFYQASNGLALMGLSVEDAEIWPVDRLSCFFDNEPELVKIWETDPRAPDDEKYFVYGPDQLPFVFRSEYLRSLVQLSAWVESAALFINPNVVDQRGEFEAWFFGEGFLGAIRYRNFEDMMIDVRRRTLFNLRQTWRD